MNMSSQQSKPEDLSLEELEKIQRYQQHKSQMEGGEPDYSERHKRTAIDHARDLAYGVGKSAIAIPELINKMAPQSLSDKVLESHGKNVPHPMDSLFEQLNSQLKKVESPYKSPIGEAEKVLGGLLAPVGVGGRVALETEAVQNALRRIPSLTKRGMGRGYAPASASASEEGVSGLSHPGHLVDQTRQFLEHNHVLVGDRLRQAIHGGYEGAMDIKGLLGELSRSLGEGSQRTTARLLSKDWERSLSNALERGGFHRTDELTRHANEHYARSAAFRKIAKIGLGGVAGIKGLDILRRML